MSTSFLRATVRAASDTTGIFVPETPTRMYPGGAEMTLVMVANFRDLVAATFDSFIVNRGSWAGPFLGGYRLFFGGSTGLFAFQFVDGAGALESVQSRAFTAADEGKTHRIIATLLGGVASFYVNTLLAGTEAFVGYSAITGTQLSSVLGETALGGASYESGVRRWDVVDIAVIDRGFTQEDVAALDKLILSTGHLPDYMWVEHYKAERLVNHPLVIDAGGQNAGRGWPAVDGVVPILGSMLIHPADWGGSGV